MWIEPTTRCCAISSTLPPVIVPMHKQARLQYVVKWDLRRVSCRVRHYYQYGKKLGAISPKELKFHLSMYIISIQLSDGISNLFWTSIRGGLMLKRNFWIWVSDNWWSSNGKKKPVLIGNGAISQAKHQKKTTKSTAIIPLPTKVMPGVSLASKVKFHYCSQAWVKGTDRMWNYHPNYSHEVWFFLQGV